MPVYRYNDRGNALRLLDYFKGDLFYAHDRKSWYLWDEKRWKIDKIERAEEMLGGSIGTLIREDISDDAKDAQIENINKWATRSENDRSLATTLRVLRRFDEIAGDTGAFDQHPYLLNVENGVLNLKTGEINKHDRKLMLSQHVDVKYSPTAACPLWLDFLNVIFEGDAELIAFAQRALGYSFTADTAEQAVFFMYGTGANGKSIFIDTALYALGEELATSATAATFDTRGSMKEIRNDLARIANYRLVTTSEAEKDTVLSSETVKLMTGGVDKMVARFMRSEEIVFNPRFKVWYACNRLPKIKDATHGFKRRLICLPFKYKIPEDKQDKYIDLKLRKERQGIFNWIVRGAQMWWEQGLNPPIQVQLATETYWRSQDKLADFLEEITAKGPYDSHWDTIKNVYGAYVLHCEENQERYPLGKKTFVAELVDRGYTTGRGTKNVATIRGLRLRQADDWENMDQEILELGEFRKKKEQEFETTAKEMDDGMLPF